MIDLQVVLDIRYEDRGATREELAEVLQRMLRHDHHEGRFSGSTEAEVVDWNVRVSEVAFLRCRRIVNGKHAGSFDMPDYFLRVRHAHTGMRIVSCATCGRRVRVTADGESEDL